jgi:hypothetical protein
MSKAQAAPGTAPLAQRTEQSCTLADAEEAMWRTRIGAAIPRISINSGPIERTSTMVHLMETGNCVLDIDLLTDSLEDLKNTKQPLQPVKARKDPIIRPTSTLDDLYRREQRFGVMHPLVSNAGPAAVLTAEGQQLPYFNLFYLQNVK